MKIKTFVLILLSAILLSSCGHYKWIQKHPEIACQVCPADSSYVEFNDSSTTIIHTVDYDTLILPPSPDSLLFFAVAYCDSLNNAQMDPITVSNNGNSATISIIDNQVQGEIICNEDSLKQIIKIINDSLIVAKNNTTSISKTIKVPVYIKAGKFYVWFTWIIIILTLLYFGFKILKLKNVI